MDDKDEVGTAGMMDQAKPRRKKASANFALELLGELTAMGTPPWIQVKDEFVSPEKALEYARYQKLVGSFRAVRIASATFRYELVTPPTPEPVLVVTNLSKPPKVKKSKLILGVISSDDLVKKDEKELSR